jgi:hypothetical protein
MGLLKAEAPSSLNAPSNTIHFPAIIMISSRLPVCPWNSTGPLTVSAADLPPNHTVKQVQLAAFYSTLGHRFIAGGNYNAKHTDWGSRLITPRGREILRTMGKLNLHHLSTGEPTYWPSDSNKLPDRLNFCVIKGIPHDSAFTRPCFDLSSDHSPVLISLNLCALHQAP